jgi:hypothetical protein
MGDGVEEKRRTTNDQDVFIEDCCAITYSSGSQLTVDVIITGRLINCVVI